MQKHCPFTSTINLCLLLKWKNWCLRKISAFNLCLHTIYCERFEPRSHFKRLSLIVRVNVVLNRTVFVDSDCHCQQQQPYSGLRSPGRSNSTFWYNLLFWRSILTCNRCNIVSSLKCLTYTNQTFCTMSFNRKSIKFFGGIFRNWEAMFVLIFAWTSRGF